MTDLRARRRLQTRREVVDTALRLFAERGFNAVSVAEIAAAAGISRRTFFTHFSGKEEAALAGATDDLEPLRRALSAKTPSMSLVDAFRAHTSDLVLWHSDNRDTVRRRSRIEAANPALAAKAAGARAEAERELITPHIAEELGLPVGHDAVALVTGAFAGLSEVLMSKARDLDPEQLEALAERALGLLQALLDQAHAGVDP